MPFGLGVDIGSREHGSANLKTKQFLILERERFRYQKVLSNIAGNDIKSHEFESFAIHAKAVHRMAFFVEPNRQPFNGVFGRDTPIFAPQRLTVSKRIGPPPRRRVCQNAAIRKRPARARIGPPCQKRPA